MNEQTNCTLPDDAKAEQADAWMAVVAALNEVAPGWLSPKGTGQDLAVAAIRQLAAVQAPEGGERAAFEAWMKGLEGYPYAGKFADRMWQGWQARAALAAQPQAVATLPAPAEGALSNDVIREVFLAHGFTVKDGQTDLKPYVFAAARALLAHANVQPKGTEAVHSSDMRTRPERFKASEHGRTIDDDDFNYDCTLAVRGDFASDEQRKSYADWLCAKLNAAQAPAPTPVAQVDRDAQEQPFEDYWQREGQFGRAGGGQYEKTFAWNAWCAARATQAPAVKAEPEGMVLVPRKPSLGRLMSMAVRYDHGLACPGYYDSPLLNQGGLLTHEQRLRGTLKTMEQVYEEATGQGFYAYEREEAYQALAQSAASQPPQAGLNVPVQQTGGK